MKAPEWADALIGALFALSAIVTIWMAVEMALEQRRRPPKPPPPKPPERLTVLETYPAQDGAGWIIIMVEQMEHPWRVESTDEPRTQGRSNHVE